MVIGRITQQECNSFANVETPQRCHLSHGNGRIYRAAHHKDALVVGWNIQDTTRLWLEGWIASQQGWRIDVLAHSLNQLRPELFEGRTLLVWCGENRTSAQQQQLTSWQEQGHDIFPLGI